MSSTDSQVQWLGTKKPSREVALHLKVRGMDLVFGSKPHHARPARLAHFSSLQTSSTPSSVSRRRVALLQPDPAVADERAQTLRAGGAQVVVLSLDPSAVAHVEGFDADVVLIDEHDFLGACWENVRTLWQHPRLRWSPILLLPSEAPQASSSLDLATLARTLDVLTAECDALVSRATNASSFDVSIEQLGPARTLRALAASGAPLLVEFASSQQTIQLPLHGQDLSDASASRVGMPSSVLPASQAVASLLDAPPSTVRVRKSSPDQHSTCSTTLDDALTRTVSAHGAALPDNAFPAPEGGPAEELAAIMAAAHRASNDQIASAFPQPGAVSTRPRADSMVTESMQGLRQRVSFSVLRLASSPRVAALMQDAKTRAIWLREKVQQRPWASLAVACWLVVMVTAALMRPTGQHESIASASTLPSLHVSFERLDTPEPADDQGTRPQPAQEDPEHETAPEEVAESSEQFNKLIKRGHAARRAEKLEIAERRFREAMDIFPDHPRALVGMTMIAIERQEAEVALGYAEALVRERPQASTPRLLLGDAYRVAGNLSAARRSWRIAARRGNRGARRRLKKTQDRD